ncbi:hypothetical protein GCM10010486_70650 [Nonomuraea roseoviolacea subsp. carminata]
MGDGRVLKEPVSAGAADPPPGSALTVYPGPVFGGPVFGGPVRSAGPAGSLPQAPSATASTATTGTLKSVRTNPDTSTPSVINRTPPVVHPPGSARRYRPTGPPTRAPADNLAARSGTTAQR